MNLTLTVLFLALANFASGETSAERGAALLRAGKYQEALFVLEEAQQEQPGNAVVANLTGIALTQLNRIEEANEHYRLAIRLNPRLEGAYKNLGFGLLQSKQYAEAERELNAALLIDPHDSFDRYYLGLVYLATGRKRQAMDQFSQSLDQLAKDPDSALAYVSACLESGDRQAADKLISRLTSEGGLTTGQAYVWASQLNAQAHYTEAVALFRYIARIEPAAGSNRYNLAIALLDAKDVGEATSILEELSQRQTDNPDVYSLLGAALELDGKNLAALEAYRHSVQLDPENPDRYLEYSRLLVEMDRFDESSRLVERGIGQVNDAYALLMRLGSVRMAAGKLADAREAFNRAVEQHPDISLGYIGIARTYLLEGNAEEAITILAKGESAAAPDFLLQYFKGLALKRADRSSESLECFQKAATLNANVPEVHYEQGKLFLKLGDLEKAREEFDRTVAIDPKNAGAFYQLSVLWQRRGEHEKAQHLAALSRDLLAQKRQEAIKRLDERFHSAEWKR